MAENQTPGMAEQATAAAKSHVVSKAKEKVIQKATQKLAEKGIQLASGAATGGVGTAIALAGMAKDYGKQAGKAVLAGIFVLPTLLSTGISAAGSGGLTALGIAIMSVPLVIALIIAIISTGAYIVPQDEGYVFQDEGNFASVDCISFSGPWLESDLDTELEALEIIKGTGRFMSTLCGLVDEVKVVYNPTQACYTPPNDTNCYSYGGFHNNYTITIYPVGTGTLYNSLYTLSHEMGHAFDKATNIDIKYTNDPSTARERPICTYPFASSTSESFAEMIALFVSGPHYFGGTRVLPCLGGTFKDKLPNTWKFARDNIFMSNGSW